MPAAGRNLLGTKGEFSAVANDFVGNEPVKDRRRLETGVRHVDGDLNAKEAQFATPHTGEGR